MTEQEQNIAIAESVGFSEFEEVDGVTHGWWGNEMGAALCPVPNYTRDLNAMHEVERDLYLDAEYACQYSRLLVSNCKYPLLATAAQRAEAYLKVKGLWK